MATTEDGGRQTVFGGYPAIGFVSIFYSTMDSPLSIWEKQERRGEIRRILDDDRNIAIDIFSIGNIHATYITSPSTPFVSLGITLPHVVFVLKNMNRPFAFTLQVRDNVCKRRFLFCNSYKTTRVKTFSCHVPITLQKDWNELAVDLNDLTYKTYGTVYKETVRVQLHANCRIRLIYFCAAPVETPQAVEIMKGILSSGSGHGKNSNLFKAQTTPEANVPEASSELPQEMSMFIEKSLAWRKQLAAKKAQSAVFGTEYKYTPSEDPSRPEETKSCPQLNFDVEHEMQRLIEEELLSFDYEMCQVHQDLEQSLKGRSLDDLLGTQRQASSCELELNIVHALAEVRTSIDNESAHVDSDGVEIPSNEAEVSETTETEGTAESRSGVEETVESVLEDDQITVEQTTQTMLTSATKLTSPSTENSQRFVNGLDEQLEKLESIVQGLMTDCPKVSAVEIDSSRNSEIELNPTASKMVILKTRIDDMKRKLRKLEENFEFSESGAAIGASRCPSSTQRLSSATPSSILRLPGTETSYVKLRPKLSVSFAKPVSDNDECEESDEDAEQSTNDEASTGGVFEYVNSATETLLSALRLSAMPSNRPKTK